MKNKPLVSVILTSYNYEEYISESIHSIFNQTYRNIELIIVDDGSQDSSRKVIEETITNAPFPVTTVFKDNGGQASAFNEAYTKVAGEVVSFLDSDDTWFTNRMQQVIDFMQMFPDGAIYQHQMETGKGLKRGGMLSADVFQLWKQWGNGVFNIADSYVGMLFSPFVPTSGLTFRKTILDRVFPIPEQLVTCADAFLTRTTTAYGPLYSLPTTLGLWRDHGQNAGTGQEYSFTEFWLPVVMPALNHYYESRDLGLTLVHEPQSRSATPAERILSQYYSMFKKDPSLSFREQLEKSQSKKGHPIARFLRLFLSESKVQTIRRLVNR